jgi:galactokinase
MKGLARALGCSVLRELTRERVLAEVPALRGRVGDRAILRALHFFDDNRRVEEQVAALQAGDTPGFLRLVVESGNSSWMLCQNCYPARSVREQGIPIALSLSRALLEGRGAWRVHGGGFAGTIQAFVPADLLSAYLAEMAKTFGPSACIELSVRSAGARELPLREGARARPA